MVKMTIENELKTLIDEINEYLDIEDRERAELIVDLIVLTRERYSTVLPDRVLEVIDDIDEDLASSDFFEPSRKFKRLRAMFQFILSEDKNKNNQKSSPSLLPTFTLDQDDKERVMALCEQLRKIVFQSSVFDTPHKKRLLNRIAAIEEQVQKEKGLYDVILGGITDFGETMNKFGTDIKPIADRIQEIRTITRKNTNEYKQIPAPEEVKKIPAPDETKQLPKPD